jgi:hypothetical protein
MNELSRRKLITAGFAATAGVSGLARGSGLMDAMDSFRPTALASTVRAQL